MEEQFSKLLPPHNCQPLAERIIKKYQEIAPETLLSIWSNSGIGKYGNGIIELVNPELYEPLLWSWLGGKKENYLPFAINAFGDIFYYRKLTETDEDICMIDIQHRKAHVLTWNSVDFFSEFLADKKMQEAWLYFPLFRKATPMLGLLEMGEIYSFTPIMALGGSEEVKYLKVNNVFGYHDFLFSFFEIEKYVK